MKEKIKNLVSKLIGKNKKINLEFTYIGILTFFLVFSSSVDVLSTLLVLNSGGLELNPYMASLIDKGYFYFIYGKVLLFPIIFMFITIILSELIFYIFKDNKTSDNFIIYSVVIYSIIGVSAGIYNFINYLLM